MSVINKNWLFGEIMLNYLFCFSIEITSLLRCFYSFLEKEVQDSIRPKKPDLPKLTMKAVDLVAVRFGEYTRQTTCLGLNWREKLCKIKEVCMSCNKWYKQSCFMEVTGEIIASTVLALHDLVCTFPNWKYMM